jgi:predicted porin
MQKKTILALAVGAAFAAPALAQTTTGSSVEIYGRIYPQVTSAEVTGSTNPNDNFARRLMIESSNSRLGFRGQEQLGGGLAAIWQIEQRVKVDQTPNDQFWANNRDSFVGFRGNWGTVRLGNFDTVYKTYGAAVGNFFGISSGNFVSSSNVLSELGVAPGGEDGAGRDGQSDASGFHDRMQNTIAYETPEFGGFQIGIQWAADEKKGNPGRPPNFNADLWSAAVKYEKGPIYVSVQYERHNDWLDASTNFAAGIAAGGNTFSALPDTTESRDHAVRLSGKFAFTPNQRVTGDFAVMEWKESGAAGSFDYKRNAWAVGWEATWGGPWRTELTYTKAEKGSCSVSVGTCTTDGLEGDQVAVGVGYFFSKRTLVFAIAAKLTNGTNAAFDNVANIDQPLGGDSKQIALGISHSF